MHWSEPSDSDYDVSSVRNYCETNVVTNAKSAWVESCIGTWLPEVKCHLRVRFNSVRLLQYLTNC